MLGKWTASDDDCTWWENESMILCNKVIGTHNAINSTQVVSLPALLLTLLVITKAYLCLIHLTLLRLCAHRGKCTTLSCKEINPVRRGFNKVKFRICIHANTTARSGRHLLRVVHLRNKRAHMKTSRCLQSVCGCTKHAWKDLIMGSFVFIIK